MEIIPNRRSGAKADRIRSNMSFDDIFFIIKLRRMEKQEKWGK